MPTYTQFVTRVRKDLQDTAVRAWETTDLYQWIDEAARDISLAARNLRSEWTASFAAGTATASADSKVIQIDDAWFKLDSGDLRYPLQILNHRDMHSRWGMYRDTRQGIPKFLTASKTATSGALAVAAVSMELRLYPIPQAAGVLYYQGVRHATINTMGSDPTTPATDVVECELGWEYLIVHYTTGMALLRSRDPADMQSGQLHMTKYEDGLRLLASFADSAHLQNGREYVPNYFGAGDYGYGDDWSW